MFIIKMLLKEIPLEQMFLLALGDLGKSRFMLLMDIIDCFVPWDACRFS